MSNYTDKYQQVKSYLESNQEKFSKEFYGDFCEILQNCETLQEEKRSLHVKLQTTQSELLQKQELLKNVEDSMDSAVFYKDLQHRYIGCNQVFEYYMACEEKDILGKTDFDLFPKQDAQKFYEINEKVIQSRKKIHYKEWVELNGKKTYIFFNKSPLFDKQKKLIGIVTVARDITREYEMQKDIERKNIMLIQQNKLVSMGEMIANIAHQWKQPLSAISSAIVSLQIKLELDNMKDFKEYAKDKFNSIEEYIKVLSHTIDDFQNFFKPQKKKEEFDIQDSVNQAVSIIKATLDDSGITIKNSVKPTKVYGFKNELSQILINLLDNARDALIEVENKDKKVIEISSKLRDGFVDIIVSDNANGIPKEIRDSIFKAYFTTKDEQKGTGIGLYMVKEIVEKHLGGYISVQSDENGSSFTISLPLYLEE